MSYSIAVKDAYPYSYSSGDIISTIEISDNKIVKYYREPTTLLPYVTVVDVNQDTKSYGISVELSSNWAATSDIIKIKENWFLYYNSLNPSAHEFIVCEVVGDTIVKGPVNTVGASLGFFSSSFIPIIKSVQTTGFDVIFFSIHVKNHNLEIRNASFDFSTKDISGTSISQDLAGNYENCHLLRARSDDNYNYILYSNSTPLFLNMILTSKNHPLSILDEKELSTYTHSGIANENLIDGCVTFTHGGQINIVPYRVISDTLDLGAKYSFSITARLIRSIKYHDIYMNVTTSSYSSGDLIAGTFFRINNNTVEAEEVKLAGVTSSTHNLVFGNNRYANISKIANNNVVLTYKDITQEYDVSRSITFADSSLISNIDSQYLYISDLTQSFSSLLSLDNSYIYTPDLQQSFLFNVSLNEKYIYIDDLSIVSTMLIDIDSVYSYIDDLEVVILGEIPTLYSDSQITTTIGNSSKITM